jgi:hypothetical protein
MGTPASVWEMRHWTVEIFREAKYPELFAGSRRNNSISSSSVAADLAVQQEFRLIVR